MTVRERIFRTPQTMQAFKTPRGFWIGFAVGCLLAVGLNLLPYLRTRGAYQIDGLEVIGFPFAFRSLGGFPTGFTCTGGRWSPTFCWLLFLPLHWAQRGRRFGADGRWSMTPNQNVSANRRPGGKSGEPGEFQRESLPPPCLSASWTLGVAHAL